MDTLLKYELAPAVEAFSTTRLSPLPHSAEELAEMGGYAAFNVTHYCGDAPERVARNRAWLCRTLGISDTQLWLPEQTHGDRTRCIDADFLRLPQTEQTEQLKGIDALVTDIPQQCIGISTADCVPLLVYDAEHHAVAAIHAGWRGTVQRIPQKTLRFMAEKYGTRPEGCRAIIGPSISAAVYEVGMEVVEQFSASREPFSADEEQLSSSGFPARIFSRRTSPQAEQGKAHLDLWAANAYLLETAGVPLEHIQIAGICTYLHSDTFFSARKLGIQSGRIFTGICLK